MTNFESSDFRLDLSTPEHLCPQADILFLEYPVNPVILKRFASWHFGPLRALFFY